MEALKNVTDNAELNLNGMRIIARTKDAVYLRIPPAVQMASRFVSAAYKCTCGHCDGLGTWDTLVVPITASSKDWAYTVHMPDSSVSSFLSYMRKIGKAT